MVVASYTRACHHAFSTGSISSPRRLARRCHTIHVNKQRAPQIVYAAAATDVGTKAVQAIKKSVGGDIFVAGRSVSHVNYVLKIHFVSRHNPLHDGCICTGVQVAMVKSQHGSCRSCYVTASKSLQVRSCALLIEPKTSKGLHETPNPRVELRLLYVARVQLLLPC